MAFIEAVDTSILWLIQNLFRCRILDSLMPIISWLGNDGGIWILLCVILLFYKRTRPTGLAMGIAIFICIFGGSLFLKNFIARARPYINDPTIQLLVPPSKDLYSFPSCHAMISFAAATVMMIRRYRCCWAAFTLASLIAFSRVYLMVHYPLDVVAGIAIGIFTAILSCRLVSHHEQKRRFSVKSL